MYAGRRTSRRHSAVPSTGARQQEPVEWTPRPFVWHASATSGAATPQEALAKGLISTPCETAQGWVAAATQTTTWFVVAPRYGLVLLVPSCHLQGGQPILWLLTIARLGLGGSTWGPEIGVDPQASVLAWSSDTRLYVAGHVADEAFPPAGALPVSIAGSAGWMTEDHGMVSVVLPGANGTTFFFAGSGSADEIQQLAALALQHENSLLEPIS